MFISPTPVCYALGFDQTLYRTPLLSPSSIAHGRIESFDFSGLCLPVYKSNIFNPAPDLFTPLDMACPSLDVHGAFAFGNKVSQTRVLLAKRTEDSYHELGYLGSVLAVKIRRTFDDDVESLMREASFTFNHPYIAKVFHAGLTTKGDSYGIMPMVDGISLEQAIALLHSHVLNPSQADPRKERRRKDPFDSLKVRPQFHSSSHGHCTHTGIRNYEEALPRYFYPEERKILRGQLQMALVKAVALAADALAFLEGEGLVHRDIKPSNILLTYSKPLIQPHIIDLGASCSPYLETDRWRSATFVGTLGYAAPELISGGWISSKADCFSLACVLYKIFSGNGPFVGINSDEIRTATVHKYPKLLVQEDINDLLFAALEKDPESRISLAQFAEQLHHYCS